MNEDNPYYQYYNGPVSDHFDGELFFNPWGRRPRKGFLDILRWRLQGGRAEWPESVENPLKPPLAASSDRLLVTYIGHASFLAQIAGINILIDPVFSDRASPFSAIGPKRVRPPFVPMDQLPPIDFVFVSHNHYDHLDLPSLSWLARNRRPVFVAPLGNDRIILPIADDCRIIALDWHQPADLGHGLKLTLTPSQHWSRRGLADSNRDLWGGFFLSGRKDMTLYYCGDSGFHEGLFQDIAARHGRPDLALLPIGAYAPRWFMKYSHMNPEEALKTFKILQAKRGMAFHMETFQLTDEAIDAPRRAIETMEGKYRLAGAFTVPYPGDRIAI